MLKRISVQDVRLGMHLHELCGAWLDHPFWKTKFVLRDGEDLRKLRASAVKECWIDTAKGLDVKAADTGVHLAPSTPRPLHSAQPHALTVPLSVAMPELGAPAAAPARAPATTPLEEEVRRAAALCSASREAVASLFNEVRMGRALDAQTCQPLVDEIASSVSRNAGALTSLARLKTHDDYTYMHSVAVCALMISLGRQLGLEEAEVREAGMAGLVHDMGKALMPLAVLNKPGKLTDEEFDIIRGHPRHGHDLLAEGGAFGPGVLDVCLHHHERLDGKGYPDGLSGDAISRLARMGAVCDVYDAITSNRPYKAGWDPAESIAQMASWRKGQFDTAVFQAFVKSLGIYPNGSLVRMQSGRLAVVMEQNEKSLVAPRVKLFFSTQTQRAIPPELLDLAEPGCTDAIVGRESNKQWKFAHLDELWAGAQAMQSLRGR
jgi:HD-GYP domain-containing protein (c-di-GMP phosphodiesterase class II)